MVGMGMPLQEIWALENRAALKRGVILTVGAAFDYEAGVQKAPPRWTGRLGVEWLARLIDQPRRLAFRYLVEPWSLIGPALGDIGAALGRRRRWPGARRWRRVRPLTKAILTRHTGRAEACDSMPVYFEGFPRVVERASLKPGRWFVAAEGARPLICFSTEEGGEADERLILTFGTTRPETLDFATAPLKGLTGPLATLEHELVFAPGLAGHSPQLTAPVRRPFRPGALLRLRNGDLGLGFAGAGRRPRRRLADHRPTRRWLRPGVRPLDAVAAPRRRASCWSAPSDRSSRRRPSAAGGRR